MVSIFSVAAVLSTFVVAIASPVDSSKSSVAERSPIDFTLRNANAIQRRQDYQQDYTSGGDVVYSPDGNYFDVKWDTQDDFVCGIGWETGSTK